MKDPIVDMQERIDYKRLAAATLYEQADVRRAHRTPMQAADEVARRIFVDFRGWYISGVLHAHCLTCHKPMTDGPGERACSWDCLYEQKRHEALNAYLEDRIRMEREQDAFRAQLDFAQERYDRFVQELDDDASQT